MGFDEVLEEVEREAKEKALCKQEKMKLKGGLKSDQEKTRMDLIPAWALEALGRVLTYGAKKYAPDNWKTVKDGQDRYYAALLRHLTDWRDGEVNDPESGMPHLWHVLCNTVFLIYFSCCTPGQVDSHK